MTREKYVKQVQHCKKVTRARARRYTANRREDERHGYPPGVGEIGQLAKLNRQGHGNCREAMRLYLRIQENGR